MKLNEVAAQPQTQIDAIKKLFAEVLSVRGSRLESILELGLDEIAFEVEFDFPEHLVKASDLKKAGKPHVAKASVTKGDQWRDGLFGALYEVTLTTPIETAEAAKLLAELKKLYKVEK